MKRYNPFLAIAIIVIATMLISAGISRLADAAIVKAQIQAELEREPPSVSDVIAANRESEIRLIEARGRSPWLLLCPAALLILAILVLFLVASGPGLKELRLLLKQVKSRRRRQTRQAPIYRPHEDSMRPALPEGDRDQAPWLD